MKRLVGIAAVAIAVSTHPAAAATVTDAIEIDTPDGRIVVTLSPEQAPLHVAAIRRSVDDGREVDLRLDRVGAGGYVQIAAPSESSWSGLEHEPGSIGNVAGAVSVYDGAGADPTLLLVLVDSHHLDADYSPVGWITGGVEVAESIAARSAEADGAPVGNVTLGRLRASVASGTGARAAASEWSAGRAALWTMVASLALTAGVALVHRRLDDRLTTSLLLGAVLMGAFAVFTAMLGATGRSTTGGLLALVVIVAVIRLMSRFEQPSGERRSG